MSGKRSTPLDPPQLSANIVRAGLQIAYWLFFQPANWVEFVGSLPARLPADFCLAELTRKQWNDATWRNFLLSASVVPTVVTLLSLPVLYRLFGDWLMAPLILSLLTLTLSVEAGVIVSTATSTGWIIFALISLPVTRALDGETAVALLKVMWAICTGVASGVAGFILSRAIRQMPATNRPPTRTRRLVGLLALFFPAFHLRMTLELLEAFPFISALALILWLLATFLLEREWIVFLGIVLALFWLGPILRDGGFYFAGLQAFAAWFFLSYLIGKMIAGAEVGALAAGLGVGIWAGSMPFHELFFSNQTQKRVWTFSVEGLLWSVISTLLGIALAWFVTRVMDVSRAHKESFA